MTFSRSFCLLGAAAALALVLTSGCAPQQKRTSPFATPAGGSAQRFNVEVSTNGQKIDNYNVRLVHRMMVNQDTLKSVFSDGKSAPKLGFVSEEARDHTGEVYGFMVKSDASLKRRPKFGLSDGDVVTAIGAFRPTSAKDMSRLYAQLTSTGESSLTFVRSGKHHKILYYLEK